MNRQRGRQLPSGTEFHHEIDYAGLPRDVEETEDDVALAADAASAPVEPSAPSGVDDLLSLKLTQSLHTKLLQTARDEGVSLEQLVQELLAEGVTLRAWEIIERKNAMRGGSSAPAGGRFNGGHQGAGAGHDHRRGGQGGKGGNHHPQSGNHGGHGGQGGGRHHGNNQRPGRGNNAWMEDKAAFLEYVRNQEKRGR